MMVGKPVCNSWRLPQLVGYGRVSLVPVIRGALFGSAGVCSADGIAQPECCSLSYGVHPLMVVVQRVASPPE
jgi:hypothetical protein